MYLGLIGAARAGINIVVSTNSKIVPSQLQGISSSISIDISISIRVSLTDILIFEHRTETQKDTTHRQFDISRKIRIPPNSYTKFDADVIQNLNKNLPAGDYTARSLTISYSPLHSLSSLRVLAGVTLVSGVV